MPTSRHFAPQSDVSNETSSASPEQQDKARALERRRTQNKDAQTRFRNKKRFEAAAAAADDANATLASNTRKRYAEREKEVDDDEGEDQAGHPKRAKTGAQPNVQSTRMITRSMMSAVNHELSAGNSNNGAGELWFQPRLVQVAKSKKLSDRLPPPPQVLGATDDDNAAAEVVSSHPSSVAGNPDEVISYSPSSVLLPPHQVEYRSPPGDLGFETIALMPQDVNFNFAQANMAVGVPTGMGQYDDPSNLVPGLELLGQDAADISFLPSCTGLGSGTGLTGTPRMTSTEISPAMASFHNPTSLTPYTPLASFHNLTSLTPPRPSESTSLAPPRRIEGSPTSNEGLDIDSLLHKAIDLKAMQIQYKLNKQKMEFIAMGKLQETQGMWSDFGLGITGFGHMR
ncbi:MAG: hypothetical protein M1816_004591 [Peltula sp. TS41687]|nr:MAG: hypothetical protein M1816_004591 [Peltula sp. TS41687]